VRDGRDEGGSGRRSCRLIAGNEAEAAALLDGIWTASSWLGSFARIVLANICDVFRDWNATTTSIVIAAIALGISAWALGISNREHKEFMNRLRARARFELSIAVPGGKEVEPGQWLLVTDGSVVYVRVQLGFKNIGERAAGPSLLNVVVPSGLSDFKWCGPGGEDVDTRSHVAQTPERLTDGSRDGVPGQYLSMEVARVARRPHHLKFIRFAVRLEGLNAEVVVPVKFTLQADELPDDVQEEFVTATIRVLQKPRDTLQ
jgi:hypothetical protein